MGPKDYNNRCPKETGTARAGKCKIFQAAGKSRSSYQAIRRIGGSKAGRDQLQLETHTIWAPYERGARNSKENI